MLDAAGATPVIVYAVLHQDMYNADWVLHEPDGDLAARAHSTDLDRLGCSLDLQSP